MFETIRSMADGTRMRQMEMQLQQVTTTVSEMQGRVETVEERIESAVDRKLEALAYRLRGDMRLQIREELQEVRDQGNLLQDKLQQFMMMFANQSQVRISPDFPPRERTKSILQGIGIPHQHAGIMESEEEPTVGDKPVVEKRRGFLVPKLELPIFEGTKPRWWLRRCEKLFEIHQVPENQRVALAVAYLHDEGEVWFQG